MFINKERDNRQSWFEEGIPEFEGQRQIDTSISIYNYMITEFILIPVSLFYLLFLQFFIMILMLYQSILVSNNLTMGKISCLFPLLDLLRLQFWFRYVSPLSRATKEKITQEMVESFLPFFRSFFFPTFCGGLHQTN